MSRSRDPLTGRRLSGRELIAQEIADLRRDAKIDSWNSFVEELHVPTDLQPGLLVGRAELIRCLKPGALTAEQAGVLYKLVAGLVDTNAALRQHTARVAGLVNRLNDALKGFDSTARSIDDFANFRTSEESEEEDAA